MAKILVLTSRWPFPPRGGDQVRIVEICRQLAAHGHELILVACCDAYQVPEPGQDAALFSAIETVRLPAWRSYLNCMAALFSRRPLQLAYYESGKMRRIVAKRLAEADVVLAHLIRMAQFVPDGFSGLKILEMTDAISMGYKRLTNTVKHRRLLSLVYRLESSRVSRAEQEHVRRFDRSFVVSVVDRDYLTTAGAPDEKLEVAPNGVSPDRFECSSELSGSEILFIGNMRTVPNIDAATFFAEQCLPRIAEASADIRFRIVGPVSPKVARSLEALGERMVVSGVVQDLRVAARDAFCAVAPMRLGAGVQNKVLDYLALGLPCVTTTIGYEGLKAAVGEEILVADTPEEIAAHVSRLHRDRAERARLAQAGREYARRSHSWASCLEPLLGVVSERHRQASDGDAGARAAVPGCETRLG